MVNYITIFDEPVLIEITKSNGEVVRLSDICRLEVTVQYIKIYQMCGVIWFMPRPGYRCNIL